jgi:ribosome-associated translation inhibitor RaiA
MKRTTLRKSKRARNLQANENAPGGPQTPLAVTMRFRQMEQSNELLQIVESEARSLKRRHPRISKCSVVIEKRQNRRRNGNPIRARVTVVLAGKVFVSSTASTDTDELSSAIAAIFNSFKGVERAVTVHQMRRSEARRPRQAA